MRGKLKHKGIVAETQGNNKNGTCRRSMEIGEIR
jgi:hypothetical protein